MTRRPVLGLVAALLLLGVAAANEKSPTESAKLTLHDEHEEPSADFSDDQLANWLADSSEDDWNEKGDSEGADAVHQHQHSKVEHLSAAQMHGEETPSGHETVPMVILGPKHRHFDHLREHHHFPANEAVFQPISAKQQVNDQQDTTDPLGISKWYYNETKYVKVECFFLIILSLMAIAYSLLIMGFRWLIKRPQCGFEVKEAYSSPTKKAKKLSNLVPRNAGECYTDLFNNFCNVVMILFLLAFTTYWMQKCGADEMIVKFIRSLGVPSIHMPGVVMMFADVLMQLFVAVCLLYLTLIVVVRIVCLHQTELKKDHSKSAAARSSTPSNYDAQRAYFVFNLKSGVFEDAFYYDQYDFSRYLALSLDHVLEDLSSITVVTWVIFGIFETIIFCVMAFAGVSASDSLAVQISLAILCPLIALFILLWAYIRELTLTERGKTLFVEERNRADSDPNPSNATNAALLTNKEGSEDSAPVSVELSCNGLCGDGWTLSVLQAFAFLTCYSVARILAAKRTYDSAQSIEVFVVLGGFVVLYFFQVYLLCSATLRCGTVFSLPPFVSKQGKTRAKRIKEYLINDKNYKFAAAADVLGIQSKDNVPAQLRLETALYQTDLKDEVTMGHPVIQVE